MSTAFLFSGQLRSFSQCYPTQKWQVFRHYPDAHFFFCVQNNEQVNSLAAIKRDYPDRVHVKLIDDPVLPEIPLSFGAHAPYANAAPHNRLLLQHWYSWQSWRFFIDAIDAREIPLSSFDTFIRMRPDNWMQSFNKPYWLDGVDCRISSPWWGRFGGINDRMAIMDATAAAVYFTLYNGVENLLRDGCPFHPESLLLAHLERNGIKVSHTLNALFGTLRLPRPDPQNPQRMIQEMRFPEIQQHEAAEYARTR